MEATKVIVLTPVKNEAWILEKFLKATELFADHIIVADQNSIDDSKEICSRFHKVVLIENKNAEYDEAQRQKLLIETARKLWPSDKRIFFCLDADEIITADSLQQEETWRYMYNLEPGTAIFCEKPDILHDINRCTRWRNNYFALGYVDDGAEHKPKSIHSLRIPYDSKTGKKEMINTIRFMHFAHARKNVQSAKLRYYSVIENVRNINPFYLRRFAYKSFYNEKDRNPEDHIETTPPEWLAGYDAMGIDLTHFPDHAFSWHDYEVLALFKKHGYQKFHLDNIWEFDWEAARLDAMEKGHDVPVVKVKKPSLFTKATGKAVDFSYSLYVSMKNKRAR